jgi:hypothetical protein
MKKEMTLTEFASMGGKARSEKLSAKRRKAIARKASLARWGKPKGKSR